jgi:class 3 adenylate cyclase
LDAETRYAKADDGARIAYQVFGEGSVHLLYMPYFLFNLDLFWDFAPIAAWLEGLGQFARVVIHDPRGTGLSDRDVEPGSLERRVADVVAVLDNAGIDRVAVFGSRSTGAVGALMGATRSERISSLTWWHACASEEWAPDYPWGAPPEQLEADIEASEERWGSRQDGSTHAANQGPMGLVDSDFQRWMGKMYRNSVTPARAAALLRTWRAIDVRGLLPTMALPTLVLARESTRGESAAVAGMIPGSELVVLPGEDHMPWFGDTASVLGAVRTFLGVEPGRLPRRFLATVLFTDIVASTQRAAAAGDERWRGLVDEHHRLVRGLLSRHGGQEMDTAGDGFFATFDSPANAVRCALEAVRAVTVIGLEIRAGVHTGEVHLAGGKHGGLAVAIGARICALAQASEVLTSSTVRDLTVGSGLRYEFAGEQELKGVPDRWRLYRVMD